MEEVVQGNQQTGDSFGVSNNVDPSAQVETENEGREQRFEAKDFEGESEQGLEDQETPFKDGKEKFTIDGEEVEMDWQEVKKSVQLARSSYRRFEDAKKLESTAQTVLTKMKELAHSNPEGLIRTLNPNWQPGSPAQQGEAQHQAQRPQEEDNPWQRKYEESEQRYKGLEQRFEEMDIAAERATLHKEFASVTTQYPVFEDKAALVYLKSEYAKSLKAGMDVSLEDTAFYVHRELAEQKSRQIQSQKQKVEQRRDRAPVSGRPAAPKAKSGGYEDYDSLRRDLGMA